MAPRRGRRSRRLRRAAAGLTILLLAAASPLATAITGTGSQETGTGGEEPTATSPPSNSPLAPMAVTPAGSPGGGDSSDPTLGGGAPEVVGFRSTADDLTPDDGNGHPDVFVNDHGVLTRVSTDPPGSRITDVVAGPSLSSAGDVVGFGAKVLETGSDVPVDQVVVVDRRTGKIEVAPPPRGGGDVGGVSISPDGTVVAWEQGGNIYLHQIGSGNEEPVLVSRGSHPGLCTQGQRVVFASDSPLLVPSDSNGTSDVFIVSGRLTPDPADDQVTRLSRAPDGGEADGPSTDPSITPDCAKVVFTSFATNLVPGDTNATADVFVHDLATATTTAVTQSDGPSGQGSISDDGGYVAFASAADNLVADDHNGQDPRNATATSFQAVDRAGRLTYATSVLSVDGPRVRVGFPATLDLATVSAGSVDGGALIDDQVLPVDNGDGRSNTNPLATRGPNRLDEHGKVNEPGDDVTDGPDLASAQVVVDDAGTPGDPHDDVSVLRYCFDEPVTAIPGPDGSTGTDNVASDRFLLEGFNSSVRIHSTKATIERVAQEDGDAFSACVRAWFPTGVDVARFKGAAVLDAAAADTDGNKNVKASKSLTGNTLAPTDGDVTGPNLRSAQADVVANRVTYVFDDLQVTDSLLSTLATRFGFVDADGALHPGRAVATADQKAHSVTVDFDVNAGTVANARRFIVLPGAVTNFAGEANVEQSTDGDVAGPELIAVTRVGPLGAPGPPRFDFTFNADVRDADVAKFVLYAGDGTGFPAASIDRPSPRVVRVGAPAVERFAESIVLGVVQSRAVSERVVEPDGGDVAGAPNPLGAKGIPRRFSPTGSVTDGPDLVGVALLPDSQAIDFTFDQPVRDVHLALQPTPLKLPTDVFVRELATGDLVRASLDGDDRELPGSSFSPQISGDGRYVAFAFAAFRPDLNGRLDIFRRDLLVAQVTPRSIDFGALTPGGGRSDPRTVQVANRGFGRLVIGRVAMVGKNRGEFKLSSDRCTDRTLGPQQVCALSVVFVPGSSGPRAGDVVVTDNAPGSPRTVPLTGRGLAFRPQVPIGLTPTLTVSPTLGRPGAVAAVQGRGFRPQSSVTLGWAVAPGATSNAPPLSSVVTVTTDTDGGFDPTALLVLPHDVLGPRLVEARGDQPGVVATAPFLVVPGTVQPEATPTPVRTGFGEFIRTLVVRQLHLVNRR